jgi:hypothetical protein
MVLGSKSTVNIIDWSRRGGLLRASTDLARANIDENWTFGKTA